MAERTTGKRTPGHTATFTWLAAAAWVFLAVLSGCGPSSNDSQPVATQSSALTTLTVTPAAPALSTLALQTFVASGGTAPYTWSISSNNSEGSISATGAYTAGAKPGVDTVLATDSLGNTGTATVTVSQPTTSVAILPDASPIAAAVSTSYAFTVVGGTGPYTWAFTAKGSGAAASVTTPGATTTYTAGPGAGTDKIKVTDSAAHTATVTITVVVGTGAAPIPTIIPSPSFTVAPGRTYTLQAAGGSGAPYTWSNASAAEGSITSPGATAVYTATHTCGADTVTLKDKSLHPATVSVVVGPAASVAPSAVTLLLNGTQTFTATGCNGGPYTWSVVGTGTITAAGVYTAPGAATTDTVKATDSFGNVATATVTVDHPVVITPGSSSAYIGAHPSPALTASGGSGVFSSCVVTVHNSGAAATCSVTSGGAITYTAGGTAAVTDTITVTDSLGHTATATIAVYGNVTISPAGTTTLNPNTAAQLFTASSGSGNYTWSLTQNTSGSGSTGSIASAGTAATEDYTPGVGASTSFTDTLKVTDTSSGQTATVTIKVNKSTVTIAPLATTTQPNAAATTFTATGGSGAYTWTLTPGSGSTGALSAGGVYTPGAGSTTGFTDTVTVTDTNAASVQASTTILVASKLVITASMGTPVPPTSRQTLSVAGGSGAYTWSIAGSGALSATSGASVTYTAATVTPTTDTITATDSAHPTNTASIVIVNNEATTFSVTTPTPPGVSQSLTAWANGGTFTWTIVSNSGATLTPVAPVPPGKVATYKAGLKDAVDIVTCTDQWGNVATATITVKFSITQSNVTVAPDGSLTFTTNEGGSATWSLPGNNSGGTIVSSTGAYKAGPTGNVSDTASATDSNGNTATTVVEVGGGLSIAPSTAEVAPKGTIAFSATGGSGSGYTWTLTTNASGGSVVAGSGVYTAGSTSGTDVIQAKDSLGNKASVTITVACGADSALQILYPYNGTVLPLALPAPLVQWSDNGSASYAEVTLQYPAVGTPTFTWSEVVAENGALAAPYSALPGTHPVSGGGRAQIPASVWTAFESAAAGNNATLSVKTLENGSGTRPVTITLHFANAELKGTIYYQSYGTHLVSNYTGAYGTGGPFGAATLAIQVGQAAPTVAAGSSSSDLSGCRVCHSVAANGSLLVTQEGTNYATSDVVTLGSPSVDTVIPGTTNDGRYEWPAISPDGTVLFSNSGSSPSALLGSNGAQPSGMYALPSGAALATTGIPANLLAMTPAFATDTSAVAFNYNSYDGVSLAMMNVAFSAGTWNFSAPSVLFTPAAGGAAAWPSFLPAGQNGVVFQNQVQSDCRDPNGTRSSSDSSTNLHNIGAQGELWWVNTSGSPVPARLDRANGTGSVPAGINGHGLATATPTTLNGGIPTTAEVTAAGGDACQIALGQSLGNGNDALVNFEPTVNPQTTGGYSWVVFTSRRMYGNVATINPWASDPRYSDISTQPTPKKLWVSAISNKPAGGMDPSFPAFYLDGQELLAGNSRGYWVLPACSPPSTTLTSANQCTSQQDCCQTTLSTCTLDIPITASPPLQHCVPNSSVTCSKDGAACNTDGDCCNLATTGSRCASGICQVANITVYTPQSVEYDFQAVCPSQTQPVWEFLESDQSTPSASSIAFSVQSAGTETALATAQSATLDTVTTTVVAPQYSTSSITVDQSLRALTPEVVSQLWLRVTVTLNPSSDQLSTPVLTSLQPTFDCLANE